eukprot:m51a1_g929 putative folliculin (638) ;mRNA; f:209181-211361
MLGPDALEVAEPALSVNPLAEPLAALSLCCFCEIHGPSVLFTTQALPPASLGPSADPSAGPDAPGDAPDDAHTPPARLLLACGRPRAPVPAGSAPAGWHVASGSLPGTAGAGTGGARGRCAVCESVGEREGFATREERSGALLVSRRACSESHAFVRQACVRALSCEWAPREKLPGARLPPPVMFGGSASTGDGWHTLAYTFRVDDARARGALRWYALLVCSRDVSLLVAASCAGWLERRLAPFILDVQSRATALMSRDVGAGGLYGSPPPEVLGSASSFRRKLAFANAAAPAPPRTSSSMLNTPVSAFQQRQAAPQLRTLAELAGVSPHALYKRLHATAVAALVDCDRWLFTPPRALRSPHLVSARRPTASPQGGTCSPRAMAELQQLHDVAAALGPRGARALLHHVLSGDQVVVRCASGAEGRATVRAVASVLPEPLREGAVCEWSAVYRQPGEYRVVGVPLEAEIPPIATIGVAPAEGPSVAPRPPWYRRLFAPSSATASASAAVARRLMLLHRRPSHVVLTVGTDEDQRLHARIDAPDTGEQCTALGEAVERALVSELGALLLGMRLGALHERWLSHARLFRCMRMCGALDVSQGSRAIPAALAALGAERRDLPVLCFWSATLRGCLFARPRK